VSGGSERKRRGKERSGRKERDNFVSELSYASAQSEDSDRSPSHGQVTVTLTNLRLTVSEDIKETGVRTKMVHGRARAPPRQTWRVAVNEGR
jgi:hypothetical protein